MSIKITVVGDVARHAVTSIGTDISEKPTASIFRIDGGNMFFRNVGTYLPNIYGVISQKTVLLKS
jgi:hypothetical protein